MYYTVFVFILYNTSLYFPPPQEDWRLNINRYHLLTNLPCFPSWAPPYRPSSTPCLALAPPLLRGSLLLKNQKGKCQSEPSAGANYVKIVSTRSRVASRKSSKRLANPASSVRRTRCASRTTSSTSLGRSSLCVIACSATRAFAARALRACLIIC